MDFGENRVSDVQHAVEPGGQSRLMQGTRRGERRREGSQ